MVKVPRDKATPRFREICAKFEQSMTSVCAELVADLMAEGWTQGEAEHFMKSLIQNTRFDLPEKGRDEIADEFLYSRHAPDQD